MSRHAENRWKIRVTTVFSAELWLTMRNGFISTTQNFEGVIHYELIPNNRTIDADLYCAQLGRMYANLSRKYPSLVNGKQVLLQQDNAKLHTARRTKEKIKELDAIELFLHQAYSPDLAPSDYHLFRSMAHFLRGRRFDSLEHVEVWCREFFNSKVKEWYWRGIKQLDDR